MSAFAQSRVDAMYENRAKLVSIAEKYVENNADDTQANELFFNYKKLNSSLTTYLDKRSEGTYKVLGGVDKFNYEREAAKADYKVAEMRKELNQNRKAFNQYFSSKDDDFKLVLTNFVAALNADVYGPPVRRSAQ